MELPPSREASFKSLITSICFCQPLVGASSPISKSGIRPNCATFDLDAEGARLTYPVKSIERNLVADLLFGSLASCYNPYFLFFILLGS